MDERDCLHMTTKIARVLMDERDCPHMTTKIARVLMDERDCPHMTTKIVRVNNTSNFNITRINKQTQSPFDPVAKIHKE